MSNASSSLRKLSVFFISFVLITGVSWVVPDTSEARKVRNSTRTSVHRNTNVNRNVNRNTNVNVNRNVNRNTNVNVHRDIDIDVDRHYHGYNYHPVATAAGVAAVATITAAAIGSIVYSLPPSCQVMNYNGFAYQQCGNTWYQPQYAGSQVTYVVINPPY